MTHCDHLEVLGERWNALILRELLYFPQRFSALRAGLPGLSAKMLTQRLKQLEACGLVTRTTVPGLKLQAYALTEEGRGLKPAFIALMGWASMPGHFKPAQVATAASLILFLETRCFPISDEEILLIDLDLPDGLYRLELDTRGLRFRTDPGGPDLKLVGKPQDLYAHLDRVNDAKVLIASGLIEISRNYENAKRALRYLQGKQRRDSVTDTGV